MVALAYTTATRSSDATRARAPRCIDLLVVISSRNLNAAQHLAANSPALRNQSESCSRDPVAYKGSEWNLYEYVGGGPLRYTDPSGLECFDMLYCGPYEDPPRVDDEIDKLRDNLGNFPFCNQCTAADLKKALETIELAIESTIPAKGVLDPCQRWCDGFANALKDLGGLSKKCIYGNECKYAFDVGLTGGHVVYRIVLCNGLIIYVDNGTVGGDDNMGLPSDIPPVVFPGIPIPIPTHDYTDSDNYDPHIPKGPRGPVS